MLRLRRLGGGRLFYQAHAGDHSPQINNVPFQISRSYDMSRPFVALKATAELAIEAGQHVTSDEYEVLEQLLKSLVISGQRVRSPAASSSVASGTESQTLTRALPRASAEPDRTAPSLVRSSSRKCGATIASGANKGCPCGNPSKDAYGGRCGHHVNK